MSASCDFSTKPSVRQLVRKSARQRARPASVSRVPNGTRRIMQEVTSTAFDETAFTSLDRNRGPFYVAPWRVAMCAAACVAACTPSSERASTDGTSADAALGGSADAGVVDGGSAFDQQMLERMQVAQIPGLAAVVVRGDQIVFARG